MALSLFARPPRLASLPFPSSTRVLYTTVSFAAAKRNTSLLTRFAVLSMQISINLEYSALSKACLNSSSTTRQSPCVVRHSTCFLRIPCHRQRVTKTSHGFAARSLAPMPKRCSDAFPWTVFSWFARVRQGVQTLSRLLSGLLIYQHVCVHSSIIFL